MLIKHSGAHFFVNFIKMLANMSLQFFCHLISKMKDIMKIHNYRQLKLEMWFRKNISRYFIEMYHESLIKWKISSRYFIDIFIKTFKFDINWQNPWSSIFVNILMKMMKKTSKKSSISAKRSENAKIKNVEKNAKLTRSHAWIR